MASRTTPKRCIDCIAEEVQTKRPAPYAGPRCFSHNKAVTRSRSATAHGRHIQETYGLSAEEYVIVKAFQGGVCAGCGKARGVKKRLAVDHDHKTLLLRSLCCTVCNKILAMIRDDPEALRRLANTLEESVITKALGRPVYAPANPPVKPRRRRRNPNRSARGR